MNSLIKLNIKSTEYQCHKPLHIGQNFFMINYISFFGLQNGTEMAPSRWQQTITRCEVSTTDRAAATGARPARTPGLHDRPGGGRAPALPQNHLAGHRAGSPRSPQSRQALSHCPGRGPTVLGEPAARHCGPKDRRPAKEDLECRPDWALAGGVCTMPEPMIWQK